MVYRRQFAVSLFLLMALVVLMTSCKDDPLGPDLNDGHFYLEPLAPEDVVTNFVSAWKNKVVAEYRYNILYDKETMVTWEEGSSDFATFVFYFVAGVDQWGDPLPDHQYYADEWANAERMFSGNEGRNGTPGIDIIDMALIPNGIWTEPSNELIEGDAWPAGTLERVYSTDLTVILKSTLPDDPDIIGFLVNSRLQFHIIPVRVPDSSALGYHKEYRLWKWHDLDSFGYRTEDANFSTIKALY